MHRGECDPSWCACAPRRCRRCVSAPVRGPGCTNARPVRRRSRAIGRRHGGRRPLDPQLDVPAVLRVIDAGQAEHAHAGECSRSMRFHQRRQRGFHGAEDDDRVLGLPLRCRAARRSGCPAPTRSSARPSPESRARSARSPTLEKPGIWLYGLGMISAPVGKHAHVQTVHVVGAVGLVGRALLARPSSLHALEDQLRGLRVQHQRAPQRRGRALAGVVVGRGADAAAARTPRRRGEGVAQVGGDALAVVAHVARPGERRPRAGSSSMTFGRCLSGRLPERISSPMMIRPNSCASAPGCDGAGWRLGAQARTAADRCSAASSSG